MIADRPTAGPCVGTDCLTADPDAYDSKSCLRYACARACAGGAEARQSARSVGARPVSRLQMCRLGVGSGEQSKAPLSCRRTHGFARRACRRSATQSRRLRRDARCPSPPTSCPWHAAVAKRLDGAGRVGAGPSRTGVPCGGRGCRKAAKLRNHSAACDTHKRRRQHRGAVISVRPPWAMPSSQLRRRGVAFGVGMAQITRHESLRKDAHPIATPIVAHPDSFRIL